MNIMGQIISKSAIGYDTLCFIILYFSIYNSCWIKSDDGAIAAFIVPIVVIILVQLKTTTDYSKLMHLQINCIFLAITLKVLWQRKTMNNQVASNKDLVKYVTVCS